MSAETERVQAIRARWQAATSTEWQRLQHYNEAQQEFDAHARADIATLLAALDAAEARVTALQTALVQATHGYLHRVGEGTGYTVWHCRLCGDTTFDTHAPNHQSWCPVLVLADSYREE